MAWILDKIVGGVVDVTVAPVAFVVFTIATFLVYLAGMILNLVTQITVVDMATTIKGLGINDVWVTIRDLANMSFIFVLLYASIKMILGMGQDVRKLIVNMVIVALLINFSLFFTKLIIDASNILAVTFYDAIAPGKLNSVSSGLSSSMMQSLHLQSIFKDIKELNGLRTIIISVMGIVITLVATFVFFAIAIMLIIRFVILVMVMALSPLAFIGMILPQAKDQTNQWWKALIGQAFFAPIYFMLTWLALAISTKISGAVGATSGSLGGAISGTISANGTAIADPTGIKMLINYIMVIGFLVSALVISKNWANKSGSGISKLTSWATGAAGGLALGGAGLIGRHSVGRVSDAIANNQNLNDAAAAGSKRARLALWTAKKGAAGSYDLRGTAIGKPLDAGKAGGKDGYAGFKKKQAEEAEKRAKGMAPTDEVKGQAKRDAANADLGDEKTLARMEKERVKELKRQQKRKAKLEEEKMKAESKGEVEKIKNIDSMILEADTRIKHASVDAKTYAAKKSERLNGVDKDEMARRETQATKEGVANDPGAKKARADRDAVKTQVDEAKVKLTEEEQKLKELQEELTKAAEAANAGEKLRLTQAVKAQEESIKLRTEATKTLTEDLAAAEKVVTEAESAAISTAKADFEKRKKSGEFGIADARKQRYANVMERSIWGRARGISAAQAAKIRGSKSNQEQLAELAKKIAKEEEEAEKKAKGESEGGGAAEKGKTS